MGDDSARLSEWYGHQVLEDCRRGVQRCHECPDWLCCDNLHPEIPEEYRACKRIGPTSRCLSCAAPLCRGRQFVIDDDAVAWSAKKEGKPVSVPYRMACWVVGWVGAIVLLALLWSGGPCGR